MSRVPTFSKTLKKITPLIVLKFIRKHRDKIAGGIEQVLASIVSMVGLIFLSRLMSIDDFGILAIATGIWLIMEMIQHSSIISPFIMSCPNPKKSPLEFGSWMAFNTVAAILVPIAFLIIGFLLLPLVPQFAQGLMLSAPMTLVGMLYMFSRRVHYHRRDRKSLLIQTLTYGLSYVLALLVVVINIETITPAWGVMILTLAYGIPAFAFTLYVATSARFDNQVWARIVREKKLIFQLGAAGSVWQLSYVGTLIILSVLSTPAAVAIFSITRTMVRPITIMLSTLLAVDFSRAVRAHKAGGNAGLRKVVSSIWFASAALTSIPIALLLFFPDFFLSLIYSEKYAHATFELQLRVLLFLPMIYGTPLDMGLAILRDTKFLVRTHTISLVIGIIILLGFYSLGQINATTALASLVVARSVTLPMLHIRYHQMMGLMAKDPQTPTPQTSVKSAKTRKPSGIKLDSRRVSATQIVRQKDA